MDYTQHVKDIEKSFEDAKKKPVHPTDSSIQPVDILPVLPSFELMGNE
jgi:RNA polymerase II-associated factor 1